MAFVNRSTKSGFILRPGGPKRMSQWVGGGFIQTAITTASTATLITQFSSGITDLEPFTIVRTRGTIQLSSDQISAAEDQEVAYGHCVVSQQAVAIGVTAVPTPVTDSGSDLFYVYEMISSTFSFASSIGFVQSDSASRFFRFDSKAMRKVPDGTNSISVVETSATSEGVVVVTNFRQLIKLH